MIRKILTLIVITSFFFSCKKEPTTWQPNWKAPIVKGTLTLDNLLPEYTAENTDGYASIVFNDTVYSFRIDTLIKLPDTSLVQKTAIAFSSVTLAPGSFINNDDIDQLYDLGEISLKRVIIRKGEAFIEVASPWPGKTKAVFEFPKVKDNFGNVFSKTYFLEAGTVSNPYVVKDTFDISDYDFDLTGADGSLANNLTANISMFSNETSASFTVTNSDTVLLSLSFSGLEAKYARGYFGQYDLSDTAAVSFPQLQKLSGILALDSLKMSVNIQNGFDLIAQAKISKLEGKNTRTEQSILLNFPFLGQFLNINPASGGLYNYEPSDYYLSMNSNNSTIIPFIENFPDSIDFGYQIKINPDGNTSGGTDQFFPNSRLNLLADAEVPLHIKLDDFTIQDTLDIDASGIDKNVSDGLITLKFTNSFPMGATAILFLIDENGVVTDSLMASSPIPSGQYSSLTATSSPASGKITYSVSESQILHLTEAKEVAISATFNTSDLSFVKINMADSLEFKVTSDLNLKISI